MATIKALVTTDTSFAQNSTFDHSPWPLFLKVGTTWYELIAVSSQPQWRLWQLEHGLIFIDVLILLTSFGRLFSCTQIIIIADKRNHFFLATILFGQRKYHHFSLNFIVVSAWGQMPSVQFRILAEHCRFRLANKWALLCWVIFSCLLD